MKKTIMVALLITLATAGMYSVMAEDGNATVSPNSSNGNAVAEGSTACCDGEGSTVCPIGNGVCDCLAHEIKDPLGNGKCYSCDGSSCNSDKTKT